MLSFSPDPLDDALVRQALLASAALHDELADHLNERLYVLGPHASPEAVLSVARQVLEEHVGPLANLLGDSIVAAYVVGAARFADHLPGGMFPDEPLPGTTWTWDGSPAWLPAVGNAAEDLARRRLVMKPDYEQLSAEARQQAFTVAHVTSQATLDKIRNAIIDAVGEGKSFPEFREDVIDAVGHSPIGPGHLDNVFRTNVASAMNRGQEEVWAQPVIRERFPYVLAEGIDDSRQTELCHTINHGGLDGTGIYRADDPVWQHFKPCRHWRCRCGCTYLTVESAAARGVRSAREWLETGEDPQDFVPWPDVELPAGWVSAGPVAMSVRHAPKGGVTIHGKPYKGGRFLPAEGEGDAEASDATTSENPPEPLPDDDPPLPSLPRTRAAAVKLAKAARAALYRRGESAKSGNCLWASQVLCGLHPQAQIFMGNYGQDEENYHQIVKLGDYFIDITADQFAGGNPVNVFTEEERDVGEPYSIYRTFSRRPRVENDYRQESGRHFAVEHAAILQRLGEHRRAARLLARPDKAPPPEESYDPAFGTVPELGATTPPHLLTPRQYEDESWRLYREARDLPYDDPIKAKVKRRFDSTSGILRLRPQEWFAGKITAKLDAPPARE